MYWLTPELPGGATLCTVACAGALTPSAIAKLRRNRFITQSFYAPRRPRLTPGRTFIVA